MPRWRATSDRPAAAGDPGDEDLPGRVGDAKRAHHVHQLRQHRVALDHHRQRRSARGSPRAALDHAHRRAARAPGRRNRRACWRSSTRAPQGRCAPNARAPARRCAFRSRRRPTGRPGSPARPRPAPGDAARASTPLWPGGGSLPWPAGAGPTMMNSPAAIGRRSCTSPCLSRLASASGAFDQGGIDLAVLDRVEDRQRRAGDELDADAGIGFERVLEAAGEPGFDQRPVRADAQRPHAAPTRPGQRRAVPRSAPAKRQTGERRCIADYCGAGGNAGRGQGPSPGQYTRVTRDREPPTEVRCVAHAPRRLGHGERDIRILSSRPSLPALSHRPADLAPLQPSRLDLSMNRPMALGATSDPPAYRPPSQARSAGSRDMAALTEAEDVVLVRRQRRRVRPAVRPAGRRRHPHQARSRSGVRTAFWPVQQPERRRPRRGPHLHLLRARGRRRPDQQLDGAGGDARHAADRPADGTPALFKRLRCAGGRCTWCRSRWARSAPTSPTSASS